MENEPYEVERKYLIRRPDEAWLKTLPDRSEIEQTYLVTQKDGERGRVRKRTRDGAAVYTHTVKRRINDLRAVELEREIDAAEYARFLELADPKRRTLYKTRYCLPYRGQLFEIDVYPFWADRAIMEIELEDEAQPVELPPDIEMIEEVSSDRRYSNAALARWLAGTGD